MPDPAGPDPAGPDPAGPDPADLPTLGPEDAKLITLARAARARIGAAEGAAVRDGDGRTYAAATVSLPSLSLSALQVAVATAVSGGSRTVEAAAVVGDAGEVDLSGLAAVAELTAGVPVFLSDPDGALRGRVAAG
jgi:hypothetical protein